MSVDFVRYLAAKKTVDDRALNRPVWQALLAALPRVTMERPLRVVEAGAGIGTMVERALAWGLPADTHYTALDQSAENVAAGRRRLLTLPPGFRLQWEVNDFFDFAAGASPASWDLLIAHAFLDLVDLETALPLLLSLIRPGGLFYFSLNFDGGTIFQPAIDPAFDAEVEALYHQTMDERLVGGRPSGDSRTGRHLFHRLRAAGAEVLAAGSSDWVVFADGDGNYPANEATFLHFIVDTISRALQGNPALDQARFSRWIARRHTQIERGELFYVAHQLDYLGRRPRGLDLFHPEQNDQDKLNRLVDQPHGSPDIGPVKDEVKNEGDGREQQQQPADERALVLEHGRGPVEGAQQYQVADGIEDEGDAHGTTAGDTQNQVNQRGSDGQDNDGKLQGAARG